MISKRTIFEIHRLKDLGWADRKIARNLRLSRATVKEYLENPQRIHKRSVRASKLDPYHDLIDQFLEQDPEVKAPVVLQRLQQNGFDDKNNHCSRLSAKHTGTRQKSRTFYSG